MSNQGNESFKGIFGSANSVASAAGSFNKLFVGEASSQGGVTRKSVVGYSPATFSTAAAASVVSFNKSIGAATTTAATALTLPVGAIVESIIIQSSTAITSGGAATLDVGVGTLNATVATDFLTAAGIANVDTGLIRELSGSNADTAGATFVVVSGADVVVGALINTAALTAGACTVYVTYLELTN